MTTISNSNSPLNNPCPFLGDEYTADEKSSKIFRVFNGREDLVEMMRNEELKKCYTHTKFSNEKYTWDADLNQLQSYQNTPTLDQVVIGREMSDDGARIYFRTSYETFFKRFESTDTNYLHYHEQFDPRQIIRGIFDLEAPKKTNPDLGSDQFFLEHVVYEMFVKRSAKTIQNLYNQYCKNKIDTKSSDKMDIEEDENSNDDKKFNVEKYIIETSQILPSFSNDLYSTHAVLSNVYFSNMYSAACFAKDIFYSCEEKIQSQWKKYIAQKRKVPLPDKNGIKTTILEPKIKTLFIAKNFITKPLMDMVGEFRSMRTYGSSKRKVEFDLFQ